MKRGPDEIDTAGENRALRQKGAVDQLDGPLFAPNLFSAGRVRELRERYATAQPFPHVVVENLCDDGRARSIEQEARTGLRADFKETDLFKVYQTPDLANLAASLSEDGSVSSSDASSAKAANGVGSTTTDAARGWVAPRLVALRDAIYSQEFRDFVSSIAACGPLTEQIDCSANAYVEGGHLLCHDDVIGTRRVSYIIYLTDPDDDWTADHGGALELYPLDGGGSSTDAGDSIGRPSTMPSKNILPVFNSMVLFTVLPGVSFHAVQEVFNPSAFSREGNPIPRLSISGWFHGEAPPPGIERATRAQLTGIDADAISHVAPWVPFPRAASTAATFGASGGDSKGDEDEESGDTEEALGPVVLASEDRTYLSEWLNPEYLDTKVLEEMRTRFLDDEDGSALQLHAFLRTDVAAALASATVAADARDGLGSKWRGGESQATRTAATLPESAPTPATVAVSPIPYGVGVGGEWKACGPVHKQRFLRALPRTVADTDASTAASSSSSSSSSSPPSSSSSSCSTTAETKNPVEVQYGCGLEDVREKLFSSGAFRRWLQQVTRLDALAGRSMSRRFRPGLDYTVAHAGTLADSLLGTEDGSGGLDGKTILDATFCIVDERDGDGALKGKVAESSATGGDEKSEQWYLWNSGEVGGFECYVEAEDEAEKDDDDDDDDDAVYQRANVDGDVSPDQAEDDEKGGTLVSVQASFNTLSLVVRDQGVMRFVKYVSASAPGSRWDITAEYRVAS